MESQKNILLKKKEQPRIEKQQNFKIKMASPQIKDGYTKIANELLEAYLKISKYLSPYENTVWLCILRKTYGYHKKEDWISLSQIGVMTNIRQSHIARSIRKLKERKMVIHSGERGKTYLTSIQKDYNIWSLLPKQVRTLLPKQVAPLLPKQVRTTTQTGFELLPKQVDTKDNTTKDNTTKDNTTVVRDYFYLRFKETFGKEYIANFGKDGKIFKDLLVKIPIIEIKKLIDMYLITPDKFIEDGGYSVGIFRSRINSLRIEKKTPLLSDKGLKSGVALNSWLKNKGELSAGQN